MRGLIVDYVGVLDGTDEDQARWAKLLDAAHLNGVSISILSNDPGGKAADPIYEWQRRGLVDHVLLSGEIDAEKPSTESFDKAIEAMGLIPSECVLVDDSILNIRAAIEHGLIGVFYQQFDRAVVEIQGLLDLSGEF